MNKEIVSFTLGEKPKDSDIRMLNNSFGFDSSFNLHLSPEYIDIKEVWEKIMPFLQRYDLSREIFFGFDIIDNEIRIKEVAFGTRLKDIENPVLKKIGLKKIALTQVEKESILTIHTHPDDPSEAKNISNFFEKLGFQDMVTFLKINRTFAAGVLSPSVHGLIPVSFVKKSDKTYEIVKDRKKLGERLLQLQKMELWRISNIKAFNKAKKTKIKENKYSDIYANDYLWGRLFSLTVYRGFISENSNNPQLLKKGLLQRIY